MGCVHSVRYLIKCNNTLSNVIFPKRGLRQGDPLSLYLFLFCVEAFSRMLIHAQSNNLLRSICASMNGPRINHLFFTDDALLFMSNKKVMLNALNFATVLGQEINFEKSMVLFSPKTSSSQRRNFDDLFGMNVIEKLDKYLSLPLPIGKKKKIAFIEVTNGLSCRINSWTKRLLSYDGKEVFIKAVLQSIPIYALSIFLALKGVIEGLQTNLSKTWWAGKDKGKFSSMLPWKTLCHPNGMEGLSIRDMRLFNLALIGRQDSNNFNAKKIDKASFNWSSIVAAAEALKNGFSWQVGNGDRVNIRVDNWGMEDLNGGALISNMLNPLESSVRDLWLGDERRWDIDQVYKLYGKD
ncbi:reverse transcriptase [Gossypium australe]|uniref:Reverse transcriptase n=1 Tax=Gossypium australe TaxID=47621 RepID=A0A5B6WSK4_9ROSI|nr:reverse transcriptase [Gossypium australe]